MNKGAPRVLAECSPSIARASEDRCFRHDYDFATFTHAVSAGISIFRNSHKNTQRIVCNNFLVYFCRINNLIKSNK